MTITRILTDKGREVVTILPHRHLTEVAEILVTNNIGAVVVTDDQGTVLGILSERDIVRAVVKCGVAVFSDTVSTHMTTKMVTTSEDESIDAAMEKMTDRRSRHLPVISHGKLVGLVSIGDMVKYRLGACEYEHKAMREYIASG